ncbi:MAG: tetratricopeptide repeat protein [Nitrospirota bacterium]
MIATLLVSLVVPSAHAALRLEPLERAQQLMEEKKWEDALDVLALYQPTSREFAKYHAMKALLLIQSRKYFESIEHSRLAYLYATSQEDKEEALLQRADTYLRMRYYAEALMCYRNFRTLFPKSGLLKRAEQGIGESSFRLGRYREAADAYAKLDDTSHAISGRGKSLYELGLYKDANDQFMMLLDRDKNYVESSQETVLYMGENFRQLGRLPDAKIYLNSVRDPDIQPRALSGLAHIAWKEKSYAAAIKLFTKALESPDREFRRKTLLSVAEIYLEWGKPDEALPLLEQIWHDYPFGWNYDTALLYLARLHRSRQNYGAAISYLSELVCRRRPSKRAIEEMESLVLEIKDRKGPELEKAWRSAGYWLLDPSRTESIIKIGYALRRSGKPYLDICRWLLKSKSEEAKAYGRLLFADFYADMGQVSTAVQYAKRASISNQTDDSRRIFGRVLFANRDYAEAADSLMKIKTMQDDDIQLLVESAQRMKDRKTVMPFLQVLFSAPGKSERSRIKFANLLYAIGNTQEALGQYATIVASKTGTKKSPASLSPDFEWACYRISQLAQGSDGTNALELVQKSKSALGRFARTELVAKTISERVN